MGDWTTTPKWLKDLVPENLGRLLDDGGWLALLAVLGILLLVILLRRLRGRFGARDESPEERTKELEVNLSAIPEPSAHSGDRKLTVEGVPVRLRLVVVAPAGDAYLIKPDAIPKILDRVLPGLGDFFERDHPATRFWPNQLSYEGFANTFHRNTPIPEGKRQPTRWVLVAGRADLGGRQILIGLGLQAVKPTTLGRRTLQPHEWETVLRVRVKEG